jgi:hypothetical protein
VSREIAADTVSGHASARAARHRMADRGRADIAGDDIVLSDMRRVLFSQPAQYVLLPAASHVFYQQLCT